MATVNYDASITGMGASLGSRVSRTDDVGGVCDLTVPKGYAGTLTTRSDDNTGTLTLDTGHGITTGQVFSVFWANGAQHRVTAGTVATNSVPIDSGEGDNLPAQGTAIVAAPRVNAEVSIRETATFIACAILYDAATLTNGGYVEFRSSGDDFAGSITLTANGPRVFDVVATNDTPLGESADVAELFVTQGSSVYDGRLALQWLQDATT